MIRRFLRTTVSFDDVLLHQIDAVCAERKITRSALIRDAVDAYVGRDLNYRTNFERIAMTSEFAQVAADILIRKLAPDRREDLIATVDERMELYHAGR